LGTSVAISSDGQYIASGSADKMTLMCGCKALRTMPEHTTFRRWYSRQMDDILLPVLTT
jgi:hypothetical protein